MRCSRSGTNARPRPSSAVKTIATQSSPLAARSDERAGKREVEDDEDRDDEEQHRRQRVARAQLEQQILARERAHVGGVVHASASVAVASGCDARGIVGGDEKRALVHAARRAARREARRLARRARCTARRARGAPDRAGARGRVRAAASCRASTTRRDRGARPRARSARAACRCARAARRRDRGGRRDRGSRAPRARGRRAARDRGSRSRRARHAHAQLALGRHHQAGAEAEERRLAGAVRAGDDGEAAAGQRRDRRSRSTRFSPKRRPSFRASITGAV